MKILCALLLLTTLAGCRSDPPPTTSRPASDEITISAAVSLRDALREISGLFETRTGTKVNLNFGASGVLQKQIEESAPVDLFAGAGAKQMDTLQEKGLILGESSRDFARNSLVLVTSGASSVNLGSFAELESGRIGKIAIGNPKTVPAGQYAEQLLSSMKLWNKLQPKIVLAGDVRQVLDYVIRDEVDAGIVYASDANIAGSRVRIVESASPDLHDPILYPVAIVKSSRRAEEARRFIELLLSAEGQSVLNKYGFNSVR